MAVVHRLPRLIPDSPREIFDPKFSARNFLVPIFRPKFFAGNLPSEIVRRRPSQLTPAISNLKFEISDSETSLIPSFILFPFLCPKFLCPLRLGSYTPPHISALPIFAFDIPCPAQRKSRLMTQPPFTLGHSPDPDDAFMFYALAKNLIPTHGLAFRHILQDIQTLNERATRGELDLSAISIHAYAHVCDQYALLPSGASMGDGYGPMLVAKQLFPRDEIANKKIAVPGTMTSAFLALQLWLGKSAREFNYIVVPFDQIFAAVRSGAADVGLIIHEGQLTFRNEGLECSVDLGAWWKTENDGLPLPLGGNVIHKRIPPALRKTISDLLTASIRYSLEHRAEAVQHALQYARDMGHELADQFVGMYVNHWTLDYGERGRESIRRFLDRAHQQGLIPRAPALEFVV